MTHNRKYKLGELAKLLEVKLLGDEHCEIHGLGTLSDAGPGELSFLSNPAYISQLADSKAAAVIVAEKFVDNCPANKLVSPAPYVTFARATALFDNAPQSTAGIHPSATIDASAVLHESVSIGPNVVIEAGVSIGEGCVIGAACYIGADVSMGENCHLNNNVTLYYGVKIGNNAIIHSGTVVGADGFGFAFDGAKSIKIHQLGSVVIADDVEIGAASTIDRGAINDTVIERGVKIDNQVQIGHNCHIGEHSVICGCSGLAGSVTIGKNCIMGGGSAAIGHVTLADGVQLSARTLVSQSITEPGMYSSGTGQMKTADWKRSIVRFQQLDSIARRLKELEKSTDNS